MSAVALSLRVDDPARFLVERFREMLEGFFWNQELDGGYLLVREAEGEFVLEAFYVTRISAGGHRVRPDLEGCNPIPQSRPRAQPAAALPGGVIRRAPARCPPFFARRR